jgi:hypothetical protein
LTNWLEKELNNVLLKMLQNAFGGCEVQRIEVRFNALPKWNEGSKYNHTLIDPEKCIQLWPVNGWRSLWICFAE